MRKAEYSVLPKNKSTKTHACRSFERKYLDPKFRFQMKLRKHGWKQQYSWTHLKTCQYRYHKLLERSWNGRSFEISPWCPRMGSRRSAASASPTSSPIKHGKWSTICIMVVPEEEIFFLSTQQKSLSWVFPKRICHEKWISCRHKSWKDSIWVAARSSKFQKNSPPPRLVWKSSSTLIVHLPPP